MTDFRRASLWVLATVAIVLMVAPVCFAQNTATISGTVVDQSGGVIPGAAVQILDDAKQTLVRAATTDATGHFEALYIQPGIYTIKIERQGFKTLVRRPITLDVTTQVFDSAFQLEVGTVTQSVSVTEVTPLVQTTTGEKSFLVEQKLIADLPLNGRFFNALVATLPGVSDNGQSNFTIQNGTYLSDLHIAGGRASQNQLYLDGQPNLTGGDSSAVFVAAPLESLSEFKVQMGDFSAEYGRSAGAAIAVQTKSGTTTFHGSAYGYVRNNAFDARNAIFKSGALVNILRYNLFGGSLGGWLPVPKFSTRENKRLFFFFNREQTFRNITGGQGESAFFDVPSPATMLNGNFSPFLLSTNMPYAPQFKNGTVFEPGTITRNGAGNITGGTPFPGNTVPPPMWTAASNALVKLLLSDIPNFTSLPASPNAGYVRDYYVTPTPFHSTVDIARVDYVINEKTTAFFRWGNDVFQNLNVALPATPREYNDPKGGGSWLANFVRIWTPTLATETKLGYNYLSEHYSPIGSSSSPWNVNQLTGFNQLYPSENTINFVPNIMASPFNAGWGTMGWGFHDQAFGVDQNLSWVKGPHTLKFGYYYYRDVKFIGGNTFVAQGTLNFNTASTMPEDTDSGLANMMLGNFQSYTQPNVWPFGNVAYQDREAFAQDSWKVTKRLAVDLGLRFIRDTPAYTATNGDAAGKNGAWNGYDVDLTRYSPSLAPQINLTNGLIVGNALTQLSQEGLIHDRQSGVNLGFAGAMNHWMPRLGFAYDVFGNGKTAFRGGAGVFYDRLRQNNYNQASFATWPNITSVTAFNGNISNVDTSVTQGAAPAIAPPALTIFPVSNVMPGIYQWNLGVQQSLPFSLALDVAYIGSRGTHLMDQRLVNGLPAGTFITNPTLSASVNFYNDALRPYKGWGSLTAVETASSSLYNAMAVRLGRRFSHGFSFDANYTWARDLGDVDEDTSAVATPFNIHAGWAPTIYDRKQMLTATYAYDFPSVSGALDNRFDRAAFDGWELSGVSSFQSGLPFTVTSNGSLQGLDSGTQYVNIVGNPYAGHTSFQWLNQAAFQRPADGSYGNEHRDTLRLPGIDNWDMTLSRTVAIREKARLTFRADAFNVFNHPQVWTVNSSFSSGTPGGTLAGTDASFGQPTAYRDPRVMQFSMKMSF